MNITKLKAGLNKQLQTLYSPKDYKYYSGLEVIEGYSKPSFFTSLELITSYVISKNVSQRSYVFLIDYFQPEKDEVDMLNKLDEIIKNFKQVSRLKTVLSNLKI